MEKNIRTIIEHKIFMNNLLYVTGEFHVTLEPVYKYINFYMTAKHIESNYMNRCKNLKQISDEKVKEYDVEERDKVPFYEQIQHFYSVINEERKINLKIDIFARK